MEGSDRIPFGMRMVDGSLVRIPVPWVEGCTEVPHAKTPGQKEGHKCWCSGLAASWLLGRGWGRKHRVSWAMEHWTATVKGSGFWYLHRGGPEMHFWQLAKPWVPAPQGLPAGAGEVSQQSGLCIAQLSCFPRAPWLL